MCKLQRLNDLNVCHFVVALCVMFHAGSEWKMIASLF